MFEVFCTAAFRPRSTRRWMALWVPFLRSLPPGADGPFACSLPVRDRGQVSHPLKLAQKGEDDSLPTLTSRRGTDTEAPEEPMQAQAGCCRRPMLARLSDNKSETVTPRCGSTKEGAAVMSLNPNLLFFFQYISFIYLFYLKEKGQEIPSAGLLPHKPTKAGAGPGQCWEPGPGR